MIVDVVPAKAQFRTLIHECTTADRGGVKPPFRSETMVDTVTMVTASALRLDNRGDHLVLVGVR